MVKYRYRFRYRIRLIITCIILSIIREGRLEVMSGHRILTGIALCSISHLLGANVER